MRQKTSVGASQLVSRVYSLTVQDDQTLTSFFCTCCICACLNALALRPLQSSTHRLLHVLYLRMPQCPGLQTVSVKHRSRQASGSSRISSSRASRLSSLPRHELLHLPCPQVRTPLLMNQTSLVLTANDVIEYHRPQANK